MQALPNSQIASAALNTIKIRIEIGELLKSIKQKDHVLSFEYLSGESVLSGSNDMKI